MRDNDYQLKLASNMNVSATFIAGDLPPYIKDDFDDLWANPSHKKDVDAYQIPSQLLVIPSSILKSKPTFLGQEGRHSNTSPGFSFVSHIKVMSN